jgi:hypothetical protein
MNWLSPSTSAPTAPAFPKEGFERTEPWYLHSLHIATSNLRRW